MPILYPSQSPISSLRLSQILPIRPNRAGQIIYGILPITIIITITEASIFFGYSFVDALPVITIIALLSTVVFTSSRYGSYSGIISSIIASIYLGYLFSIPEQPFVFEGNTGRSALLISFLFVGLAIATGYLRERIEQSLFQEQLARALAEEQQLRLESILERMPISVVITDHKTNQIIYSNQQTHLLINDNTEPSNNNIQQVLQNILDLKNLTQSSEKEVQFPRPNGDTILLKANSSPIFDLSGQHVSTVTTLIDITQQKEIEQRKDAFISIASHELKTPVTSLKIYLQLLSRQNIVKTSQDLSDIVAKANNQTNKLARLMSDLLDVNQIQTGKSEYHFRLVSINSIVREIVANIKDSTHHKISVHGKAAQRIPADPEKISQVIINLLNNAIRYSADANKIDIHIRQDEKQTVVSVQDFGIGIEPKLQKKIFERFYQIRQSSHKSVVGLGIGLYVCKVIIDEHGGSIWVDSRSGQGATFTFSLPNTKPSK